MQQERIVLGGKMHQIQLLGTARDGGKISFGISSLIPLQEAWNALATEFKSTYLRFALCSSLVDYRKVCILLLVCLQAKFCLSSVPHNQ